MGATVGERPGAPVGIARETVLVTGSAGMLGSHVVDQLANAGARVIAVDLQPSREGFGPDANSELVTEVSADITDAKEMKGLLNGCTAVIHLAAMLTKSAVRQPGRALMVNLVATHQILESSAELGIKRVVLASSGAVYGEPRKDGTALGESDPLLSRSFYAVAKISSELYAEAFHQSMNIQYVALRLGTMYGPRLGPEGKVASYMHSALSALEHGRRPQLPISPADFRDLVYVEDAADAVVRSLTCNEANLSLNIGSGRSVTNRELFARLLELAGYSDNDILWGTQPAGLPTHGRTYNAELADTVLGDWRRTPLDQGIRLFLEWRSGLSSDVIEEIADAVRKNASDSQ